MLLEYGVEIGAAEAQGGDAGAARVVFLYPGAQVGVEVEGGGTFGQRLQRGVDLYSRGEGFVVEREGGLYQARRAGCGLGVADHGFYRAEGAPGALLPAVAV